MTIFLKILSLVVLFFNISSESFAKNNNETEITVTFNTDLFRTIYLFLDNRLIKEVENGDVIKFKVKKGKHLICATLGGLFGGRPNVCHGGTYHIYKYDNVDLVWAGDGTGAWYRFYISKKYNNEKIIASDDKHKNKKPIIKYKKENNNTLYRVGSGTGFAVSKEGFVVTNNHVINGCQKVKIHAEGKVYTSDVVSRDSKNDLALIKGKFKPKFVFPISNKPSELMEEVYVAGFPFGYRLSTSIKITKGIISSLAGLGDDFTRVQIDAAIQPGNSGGPIYDNFGNIVGVAVAKLDYKYSMKELDTIPELTNFGIKASMLKAFLSASRISMRESFKQKISNLGRAVQDGTYYVSCLMTMAQYRDFKSKKVLFKEDQVSAEEKIN